MLIEWTFIVWAQYVSHLNHVVFEKSACMTAYSEHLLLTVECFVKKIYIFSVWGHLLYSVCGMVGMLGWKCLFFQSTDCSKGCTKTLQLVTFTHSHSDGRGCYASHQLLIRSNFGFNILFKDTLTCSWGSQGFKPMIFWWLDDHVPPDLQPPQKVRRWWSDCLQGGCLGNCLWHASTRQSKQLCKLAGLWIVCQHCWLVQKLMRQ